MPSIVTYIRVSTAQQGKSGLGIEAQRDALIQFAKVEGLDIAKEFVEIESGKGGDALDRRPQLKAALAAAKKLKCSVVVAKLDRLSRDVHFISGLMAHKVPFVVASIGLAADPFMLHIYAAFAQQESSLISQRTRDGLAAAKARGVKMGNPNLHLARRLAAQAGKAEANRFANNVLPIIKQVQKSGAATLQAIADALNARGIATARGGSWHPSNVKNVLDRAAD
jgi:DNA invertase Pin-like site-specific DNA recombinase